MGRELCRAASSGGVSAAGGGGGGAPAAWGLPQRPSCPSGAHAPTHSPLPPPLPRARPPPTALNSRPGGCCNLHFWREHKTVVSLTQGLWPAGPAAVSARGAGSRGEGEDCTDRLVRDPFSVPDKCNEHPVSPSWVPGHPNTEPTQPSGTPGPAGRSAGR